MPEMALATPIQQFYSDSNVFITGATGFLGRILVEKLLRSCPNVNTIYILVRHKKGKNLEARIDELLDDAIFERLKAEQPKFRHKVVGIGGDVSLPALGIAENDRQTLVEKTNIVFHVAATVRFDEKLKMAVATNIRGPHDILQLAKQMPNLKSFVHVSTAYSNVPQTVIEERPYPAPVDSRKLILLAETLSDKLLDNITPQLLDKWPNTYTFTKQIAEDVVREESRGLPVAIFRPAIVVSTYREPIKGWINNLYGPTGVCAGAGTGVLRALNADPNVNANIVPVDMCVNALIAIGWETAQAQNNNNNGNIDTNTPNEIPIYHYESSNDQPINWGRFMYLSHHFGIDTPSVKAIWYYCFHLFSNFYLFTLATLVLHYLPAIFVDFGLICIGKSPKMLKIYKKIHKFTSVISYFSTRNWTFKSERLHILLAKMTEADRKLFFCDLRQLDWVQFFATYMRGIRIYLIQDPMETLQQARTKWRRLCWIHNGVKIVLAFIVFRLVWLVLGTIFNGIIS